MRAKRNGSSDKIKRIRVVFLIPMGVHASMGNFLSDVVLFYGYDFSGGMYSIRSCKSHSRT